MKKLILSFCLSFLAVSAFAQDEEQEKEIITTELLEVVVVGDGVIDLAKDRVTPVAVSTITAEELAERGVASNPAEHLSNGMFSVMPSDEVTDYMEAQWAEMVAGG